MTLTKDPLVKINDYLWEIPKTNRPDMRVPARIYASELMLEGIRKDRSFWQLVNVTTLPGIVKAALVMPDVHEGYGFPIGAVAAIKWPDGVISPGGIGYDINCGVRLLTSNLTVREIQPHISTLAQKIYSEIPSGVGRGGKLKLDKKTFDKVLNEGVKWTENQGYTEEDDKNHIESCGTLTDANSFFVSDEAKARGCDQLGTMGAGNHFVEIDLVEKIFNEPVARAFNLFPNQITILIHTGSRGLGHQVATDYIRLMLNKIGKYNITIPDRELACAPFSSDEGKAYFQAMSAAANFAWANRQIITHNIRSVWQNVLGKEEGELLLLYDVAHNIAKIEEHKVDSKIEKLIVHRKGATRAFAPFSSELPENFRNTGQPVIIPGSMGTSSYVLVGTLGAMEQTFGSTCHGAGRRMSRHAAKEQMSGNKIQTELEKRGIAIYTGNVGDLAEEGPFAYKDVDRVVDVVDIAGIAKKVAKLRPLVVIKG